MLSMSSLQQIVGYRGACYKTCKSIGIKLLLPFIDLQIKNEDAKLDAPPLKPKDPTFTVKEAIILVHDIINYCLMLL